MSSISMNISTYIASTIISLLPLGFLIPETFYKCGEWIWWIYSIESKNIYVCEWDWFTEFYKSHEVWHKFYFEDLPEKYKLEYTKLYNEALKKWIVAFHREYGMNNVQEDFADNFALIALNQKSKKLVELRKNKIKFFIRKTIWER